MAMKRKTRRKLLQRLRQFLFEKGFVSAAGQDFKQLARYPEFSDFPEKEIVEARIDGVEANKMAKLKKRAQFKLNTKIVSGEDPIDRFYKSYVWRKLRYETLLKYGRKCMLCGTESGPMHVDHIRPLRKNWHRRLDAQNVQVLCALCNHGKGNWDETDHRPRERPRL